MITLKDFYLSTIKGRPSAEVFHGTACVYALLERRMAEYFKPYELTPVTFNALMLIKHVGQEQGLTQNDISRLLIVTPSNTTRLVDRLQRDGYIDRMPSAEDRRINIVKITRKGSDILDKVWYGYGEMIQETAYLLDRKEVEQLSALLTKWFLKLEQNTDSRSKSKGEKAHE